MDPSKMVFSNQLKPDGRISKRFPNHGLIAQYQNQDTQSEKFPATKGGDHKSVADPLNQRMNFDRQKSITQQYGSRTLQADHQLDPIQVSRRNLIQN